MNNRISIVLAMILIILPLSYSVAPFWEGQGATEFTDTFATFENNTNWVNISGVIKGADYLSMSAVNTGFLSIENYSNSVDWLIIYDIQWGSRAFYGFHPTNFDIDDEVVSAGEADGAITTNGNNVYFLDTSSSTSNDIGDVADETVRIQIAAMSRGVGLGCTFWNRTKNDGNWTVLYNNTNGCDDANFKIGGWTDGNPVQNIRYYNITLINVTSEVTQANIIHPTTNGVYNSTSVALNWSTNQATSWCAYSIDGGTNNTAICPAGNNPTNVTMTSLSEGDHNVTLWVNSSNNIMGTSTVAFSVDTTLPNISTIDFAEAQVLMTNNSDVPSSDNLIGKFNFSDNNLFAYEIRIDGLLVANQTGLNVDNFTYNLTLDVMSASPNITPGIHYLNVSVWDGGTSRQYRVSGAYPFYIINASKYNGDPHAEGERQIPRLNFTIGDTNIDINTTLIYNGTPQTTTKTAGTTTIKFSSSFITPKINNDNDTTQFLVWNMTYGLNNILKGFNQTIHRLTVNNCSTGLTTTKTLHYIVRDETTLVNITADSITSIFEVFHADSYGNDAYMRNYSIVANKTDYMDVCIYPHWAEYQIDVILQYANVSYDTRDWVRQNYFIDNTSETVILYLLSSATASDVIWHVTDQDDDEYANVLIEMQLYEVASGEFISVGSELTDQDGQAKFSYDADDYYRFIFSVNGETRVTTTKTKIIASDLYIQLIEEATSIFNQWLDINTLDRTLVYNNDTRIVTLTWDDTTTSVISKICLNVTYGVNVTSLSGECSLADSGTMIYTRPSNLLNTTLIATAYGYNNDDVLFTLNRIGLAAEEFWKKAGEQTSSFAWIIILTLGLLGTVKGAIGVIVGTDLGLIISYSFALMAITLPALVGVILVSGIIIVGINKLEGTR